MPSSYALLTSALQVLNHLPSPNSRASIGEDITITFLDEFRIIVLTPAASPVPEFTIFDTLVPRNHQVRSRRFCVPTRYCDWWYPFLHVDGDRCLGTLGRPLTTDPAQAVLAVRLVSLDGPQVFLIVRVQTLIECVRSMSLDTCVPWEEWGRDAAVMEVPDLEDTSPYEGPFPLIQGVRVSWVNATPDVDYLPHLCSFDLSRRGWSALPLRGEGYGTERKVAFEDGRQISLQGDEGMPESQFYPLGDCKFVYLVSRSCRWKVGGMLMLEEESYSGLCTVLHVWELV